MSKIKRAFWEKIEDQNEEQEEQVNGNRQE